MHGERGSPHLAGVAAEPQGVVAAVCVSHLDAHAPPPGRYVNNTQHTPLYSVAGVRCPSAAVLCAGDLLYTSDLPAFCCAVHDQIMPGSCGRPKGGLLTSACGVSTTHTKRTLRSLQPKHTCSTLHGRPCDMRHRCGRVLGLRPAPPRAASAQPAPWSTARS